MNRKNGNYVRVLLINYSSVLNMIAPQRLFTKLSDLGLSSGLCAWVLDFHTGRSQVVKICMFPVP